MADIYVPGTVPDDWDQLFISEELAKIAAQLGAMELPYVRLVPQHVAPVKLFEGMVVSADGADWDPGTGAGLYEYVGAAWVKL